ncbi:MAG: hypothetical protein KAS71_07505 [Bacteroidales bacterium]|nr:hypothetical protein [Bacteroidales bacterium]
MLLKYSLLAIILLTSLSMEKSFGQIVRKSKIEFYSSDSLLLTADHYFSKKGNQYILFFHSENSSRGEFDNIANRFTKMRYNCLAVDLRTGNKYGYIKNESAERASRSNVKNSLISGEKDILAAIEFAQSLSNKNLILFGSSSSASLSLKIAAEINNIDAVMALSPGEYFKPEFAVQNLIPDFNIPIFVAGNKIEEPYLNDMFFELKEEYKSIVDPADNSEGRGTELLSQNNPANNEYWMAVLIFIKSLNPN